MDEMYIRDQRWERKEKEEEKEEKKREREEKGKTSNKTYREKCVQHITCCNSLL